MSSHCLYKGFTFRKQTQPPLDSDPGKEDVCLHQPQPRSRAVLQPFHDHSLRFMTQVTLEANAVAVVMKLTEGSHPLCVFSKRLKRTHSP